MEITKEIAERKTISLNAEDNFEKLKYFDQVENATALIKGKLLKENLANGYWKSKGYDSFGDFIAQGGFSFTRRTAYNYIDLYNLYEKWQINYDEFIEIPYSKLLRIKNVITKDNLSLWLARAKELSRGDLETEIMEREEVGDEKFEESMFAGGNFPKVYKHNHCGKFIIEIAPDDCCKRWLRIFVEKAQERLAIDKDNKGC